MPAATRLQTPRPDPPASPAERLFEAHHRSIFGAAYRVTGDPEDAEDVLQTIFLRLVDRPELLDPARDPLPYLRRAAVNAAVDLLRRRGRSRPLDGLPAEPAERPAEGPDGRSDRREMRRALRRGLAGVSPRAAEIFALRYFEGRPNREIADLLDTSPTAVAVSLHRTRGRLADELAAFSGGLS